MKQLIIEKFTREERFLRYPEIQKFIKNHRNLEAIYVGNDPEEEDRMIHYFIIPGKINSRLDEEITSLELSLSGIINNYNFMRLPIKKEQANEYGFLGECIWKRN